MSDTPHSEDNILGRATLSATVVICNASRSWIGTGFVISSDGKIITCAHVISKCIDKPYHHVTDETFHILFPISNKWDEAKIHAIFKERDDDIAVLQLVSQFSPIPPEQIPYLVSSDFAVGRNHEFSSWGYCEPLGKRIDNATGKIGETFILIGENKENTFKIISQDVDSGMSGAAVFDINLNAVIGIISRTVDTTKSKNRDTSEAVNMRVIEFTPMNIPLYTGELPVPLTPAPLPRPNVIDNPAQPKLTVAWNRAPEVEKAWVGREKLLEELTSHYDTRQYRVLGLIGFGGEGKTSLARKWVQTILDDTQKKPDGVFWWSFYQDKNVDTFLEHLLVYVAGEKIATAERSATSRVHRIADTILKSPHRYIIILDGFEVMQDEERVGIVTSETLRDLLKFLALSHSSLCLITSRLPISDLDAYITTYKQVDITRMNETDGLALFRQIGVVGDEKEITKLIEQWGGHALTLGLIAGDIVDTYKGNLAEAQSKDGIPSPLQEDSRYDRVKRLLRRYDENLSDAGRAFMTIFCAFRTVVREPAFGMIFLKPMNSTTINTPLMMLSHDQFDDLVANLLARKLIIRNIENRTRLYSAHPLIRSHYDDVLMKHADTQGIHRQIAFYYQAIATGDPKLPNHIPTLDDLKPYIETVHHLCRAGEYELAFKIWFEQINRKSENLITKKFGAYKIELDILHDFFQDSEIIIKDPKKQRLIIDACAFCYQSLGKFDNALVFWQLSAELCIHLRDMRNASNSQHNVCHIHILSGQLENAVKIAEYSLELVESMDFRFRQRFMSEYLLMKCQSICYQAWSLFLIGKMSYESILSLFLDAEKLEQESSRYRAQNVKYLYSIRGIFYAKFLSRIGIIETAYKVTQANIKLMQKYKNVKDVILCYYILGDLDANKGKFNKALRSYNNAIEQVRKIDKLDTLIEALLARGRFFAKHMKDAESAFTDLNEALYTAQRGEYRLYEADIRIALAWAYLAAAKPNDARREAQIALKMSQDMGYHWGKVDAEEVLTHIEG